MHWMNFRARSARIAAGIPLIVGAIAIAQTPVPQTGSAPPAQPGQAQPQGRGGEGRGGGTLSSTSNEGADFSPKAPIKARMPEEEAKSFVLPPGYRMELVVAEPQVISPAVIEFDGNGRMYVAE